MSEDIYDDFDQKIFPIKFFTYFVMRNLGLNPHMDWLRIQQQAVSESGLSRIPGSGSETLVWMIWIRNNHFVPSFGPKTSSF